MRGLLVKDYRLTVKNKKLFFVFGCIGFLMLFTGDNPSFLASYISIVSAMMVLTTITYDEFDRSIAYLLTMPANRRIYVREKYLFGIICTFIGWVTSSLVVILYQVVVKTNYPWNEILLPLLIFLYLALMMLLLMVPVQIKFGGDNGKVVILAFVILIIVLSAVFGKAVSYFHIDLRLVLDTPVFSNKYLFGSLVALVHLFLIAVSYRSSMKIMEKKEF
ncbi:MAG: ABC-2 transporter permease [Blautia sp.]|jgi:ABC-2 type transport system permease protein